MFRLIKTEYMKNKRNKSIIVYLGILILFMIFFTLQCTQDIENFKDFYTKYIGYILMVMIFLIGILFIKSYSEEYKNDTLKSLLQIPLTMNKVFFVKVLYTMSFNIFIMVINNILMLISATICGIKDITIMTMINSFGASIIIGIVICLTIFPIFFISVLTKSGVATAVSINFLYVIFGLAGMNQFVGIHPISSAFNIILMERQGNISNNIFLICLANIIIAAIIFSILTIVINRIQRK